MQLSYEKHILSIITPMRRYTHTIHKWNEW